MIMNSTTFRNVMPCNLLEKLFLLSECWGRYT